MSRKRIFYDTIVVGGGASGMMAAVTAARSGASVLVLEHMDKPGKKLYATGNGRCNFTNLHMDGSCYHGSRRLYEAVAAQFSVQDTLSFFREIGVYPTSLGDYVYPRSMQASSVAAALAAECARCGVVLLCGQEVRRIVPRIKGFLVQTGTEQFEGTHVIVAAGLCAAPKLGSDGTVFSLLKELGHRFTPMLPALCGFYASGMNFKRVSGVRADVGLTLLTGDGAAVPERGQLQLTDYGVSGIPVFQLSSEAVRALHEKKKTVLLIDFLPELSMEEINGELSRRLARLGAEPAEHALLSLVNDKLIPELFQRAGISEKTEGASVRIEQLTALCRALKEYPVTLRAAQDFSHAQVCAGGVRTEELECGTLASRLVPGLFFAGELLDVDGVCGGYNLQWAWASGYVAGRRGR